MGNESPIRLSHGVDPATVTSGYSPPVSSQTLASYAAPVSSLPEAQGIVAASYAEAPRRAAPAARSVAASYAPRILSRVAPVCRHNYNLDMSVDTTTAAGLAIAAEQFTNGDEAQQAAGLTSIVWATQHPDKIHYSLDASFNPADPRNRPFIIAQLLSQAPDPAIRVAHQEQAALAIDHPTSQTANGERYFNFRSEQVYARAVATACKIAVQQTHTTGTRPTSGQHVVQDIARNTQYPTSVRYQAAVALATRTTPLTAPASPAASPSSSNLQPTAPVLINIQTVQQVMGPQPSGLPPLQAPKQVPTGETSEGRRVVAQILENLAPYLTSTSFPAEPLRSAPLPSPSSLPQALPGTPSVPFARRSDPNGAAIPSTDHILAALSTANGRGLLPSGSFSDSFRGAVPSGTMGILSDTSLPPSQGSPGDKPPRSAFKAFSPNFQRIVAEDAEPRRANPEPAASSSDTPPTAFLPIDDSSLVLRNTYRENRTVSVPSSLHFTGAPSSSSLFSAPTVGSETIRSDTPATPYAFAIPSVALHRPDEREVQNRGGVRTSLGDLLENRRVAEARDSSGSSDHEGQHEGGHSADSQGHPGHEDHPDDGEYYADEFEYFDDADITHA